MQFWRHWRGLVVLGVLSALLCACPKKNMATGVAGAAAPGAVGDSCQSGSCISGYICERSGMFNGQCTVNCNSDQSCTLLDQRGRCFGTNPRECGLPCMVDLECPPGTHCVGIVGSPMQKACQAGH